MKITKHSGKLNIIGDNLLKLRKEAGLTQNELSIKLQLNECDLTSGMIGRIERNQRLVSDYEVKAIASYFEITTDQLLNND